MSKTRSRLGIFLEDESLPQIGLKLMLSNVQLLTERLKENTQDIKIQSEPISVEVKI